jgi:CHAT domain-containing protein
MATPRVLAVGDPAFDPNLFRLPRLPGAEREARRIGDDYSGARLLVGPAATKSAFLRDAALSDIVHFAGHGVVTPEAPLLSHLVLASEPQTGASGALYARELFAARLPRTRVAILSGCQTADGHLSDTEGTSSLARAFFAAGVPAVVASLWAVNDAQTGDFFVAYHAELSRGVDPATALRQTQRRWLAESPDRWRSVSTWAGFQLFGATSERHAR